MKLHGPGFWNLMSNAGYKSRPSFRVSFCVALFLAAGLVVLAAVGIGL